MTAEQSKKSAAQAVRRSDGAGSVGKTIDVLDLIMHSNQPPSAAQVSNALGLPRPTANRIIGNLIRLGLLERDPDKRELMEGERLLSLALSVIRHAAQRGPRHRILLELAARTEETCNVGMIVGGSVRYVDRVEAKWPLSLRLEPGSEIPLHCTAIGKLLLAHLPRAQRDKYLQTLVLQGYTPNTITGQQELEQALDAIADEGVALDDEEYLSGVVGMAVPVPLGGSHPVLGLAVAAPSARVAAADLREELPLLREFAEKLALCYSTE